MPLIFVNTETQGSLTLARSPGYTNGKLNFSLSSSITYIVSKNLTGSQGLTVGATITKDMNTGNVPAAIIGDYTFPGTVSPPTSLMVGVTFTYIIRQQMRISRLY
jgi:hypothetical protein